MDVQRKASHEIMINNLKLLIILTKSFIADVLQGRESASSCFLFP